MKDEKFDPGTCVYTAGTLLLIWCGFMNSSLYEEPYTHCMIFIFDYCFMCMCMFSHSKHSRKKLCAKLKWIFTKVFQLYVFKCFSSLSCVIQVFVLHFIIFVVFVKMMMMFINMKFYPASCSQTPPVSVLPLKSDTNTYKNKQEVNL